MAYGLRYALDIVWIPDGAGPMTTPDSQRLKLVQTAIIQVPGGDTPTLTNFETAMGTTSALAGSMVLDLQTQINAKLTYIQGWATGGN